jgi:hypothetical protein
MSLKLFHQEEVEAFNSIKIVALAHTELVLILY